VELNVVLAAAVVEATVEFPPAMVHQRQTRTENQKRCGLPQLLMKTEQKGGVGRV